MEVFGPSDTADVVFSCWVVVLLPLFFSFFFFFTAIHIVEVDERDVWVCRYLVESAACCLVPWRRNGLRGETKCTSLREDESSLCVI